MSKKLIDGIMEFNQLVRLEYQNIYSQLQAKQTPDALFFGCSDSRVLPNVLSQSEPFKRWLTQVGSERLDEIENPEIAAKRMREIYKAKGYSDEWIEKRVRGIAVRDELSNEWKERGIKEQAEYSILTAEISKATFGMTPSE